MRYVFSNFEVSSEERRLIRDGVQVPTEPRILDVLLFLIQNRSRVVTRKELLEACWPGIYVSDGALSRCLSRVRKALDQPRDANSPIQTLHSKGYRFVAELDIADEGDPEMAPEETQEQPAVTQAHLVERRFMSLVHVSFRFADAGSAGGADRALGFVRDTVEVAARHGCSATSPPGGQLTINVGYPQSVERPARLAVTIADAVLAIARRAGAGVRVTITSGVASVQGNGESDGSPAMLTGLDPLQVVAPITRDDAELLLDRRTARMLGDRVALQETERLLVDGQSTSLFKMSDDDAPSALLRNYEPPFVGRTKELLLLSDLWDAAAVGKGRSLLITGEPGIGKTGLVEEFLLRTDVPSEDVFVMRCSPHHTNTPFYPQLLLLREMLEIDLDTPPIRQLRLIEKFLEQFDRPPTDHLPILASLLTVTETRRPPATLRLDGERSRRATMEAIIFMILSTARERPVLLWIDDIQWADPSTLVTLERLLEEVPESRMLVVACGRTGAGDDLQGFDRAKHVHLEPMEHIYTRRFLSDMSEHGTLPSALIDPISKRSEGVPLYLREILRMALEAAAAGERDLAAYAIPDSLQGLLAGRLEATGAALLVVQWASVIGKIAPRDLLLQVCGLDEAVLDAHLTDLVDKGILSAARRGGAVEYSFTHGLIRDAAYESMLVDTRRERHLKVAEAFENYFPAIAAAEPERIAIHYSASTEPRRAAAFWQAAGEASIERHALKEARMLFRQAIDASAQTTDVQHRRLAEEIEAMLSEF